jgi:guanylate kinase
VVISSPSGGGKTTVIRNLLDRNPDFVYSISATTRPPRPGEKNGEAYHFYSRGEFQRRIKQGEFLEWEEVYGDYYGTPKEFAVEAASRGKTVLFDLDIKGALKLKRNYPRSLLIFIMPPSMEVLEQRLRERSTDDEARLKRRLQEAENEIRSASRFDYVVVNEDLEETIRRVETIIRNVVKEDERS